MLTTVLDVIGLCLFVAAFAAIFGLGGALLAASAAVLAGSWFLAGDGKR